jgi:hypothetical protein
MSNDVTTTGRAPWRYVLLDADRADPKLILATVEEPGDVEPVFPAADTGEVLAWVQRRLVTEHVTLVPLPRGTIVWRVDETPPEAATG